MHDKQCVCSMGGGSWIEAISPLIGCQTDVDEEMKRRIASKQNLVNKKSNFTWLNILRKILDALRRLIHKKYYSFKLCYNDHCIFEFKFMFTSM